jgi:CRISPR-associated protein (TIGR03984 family)
MSEYFKPQLMTSKTEMVQSMDSFYHLEQLLDKKGLTKASAIFYFANQTAWAKVEKAKFIFKSNTVTEKDFQFITECRIFNAGGEIFLKRGKSGKLEGRIRFDGQGESVEVVDVRQLILGHPNENEEAFYLLQEEQGQSGWVPFEGKLNPKDHLAVQTRNYIGYSGLNAGYIDSRLVEIVSVSNKEEGEV